MREVLEQKTVDFAKRLSSSLRERAGDTVFRRRTSFGHCRMLYNTAELLDKLITEVKNREEGLKVCDEIIASLGKTDVAKSWEIDQLWGVNKMLRENLTRERDEHEKTKSALENVKQFYAREENSRKEEISQNSALQSRIDDLESALVQLSYGRDCFSVPAAELLSIAHKIVGGDRNVTHGDKERSFEAIAAMWNAYIAAKCSSYTDDEDVIVRELFTAADVAHMMVLMKMGRSLSGQPIRDHYIDMAGYSAIAGELALEKK